MGWGKAEALTQTLKQPDEVILVLKELKQDIEEILEDDNQEQ